jgi:protein arginine kinase activator
MYEKLCPKCGNRLSSFYKTGYLGCPHCYEEFNSEITATLRKFQGGTSHVGKKPKLTRIDRELLSDYQNYLKEKEIAGIEGRFKDMAKLNKIIEELSEELNRRGLL